MVWIDPDTIVNTINEDFIPEYADLVWTNDCLFNFPGAPEGSRRGLFEVVSGEPRRLRVATDGYTAQNYVSGQAAPVGQAITWTNATYVPEYGRVVVQFDNRLWDDIPTTDPMAIEAVIRQHMDKVPPAMQRSYHDIFLGTGGVAGYTGLLAAVDDTITYAGISRVTYAEWASYVEDGASALAVSDIEDIVMTVTGEGYGARKENLVLTFASDQLRAYRALPGISGTAVVAATVTPGGTLDLGYTDAYYGQIPILDFPELDDGTFLAIDRTVVFFVVRRPLTAKIESARADCTEIHFTSALELQVRNPKMCAKRENLT